jgi:HPt (histidine-containing phosphotransfer) domain-containing protein
MLNKASYSSIKDVVMKRNVFDVQQFMMSLANDEELARELVDAFLEDGPKRMAAFNEALDAADAENVSKLAHSLKGMSGVVHASALSDMALEMEYAARNGKLSSVRDRHAEFTALFEQASDRMKQFLSEN